MSNGPQRGEPHPQPVAELMKTYRAAFDDLSQLKSMLDDRDNPATDQACAEFVSTYGPLLADMLKDTLSTASLLESGALSFDMKISEVTAMEPPSPCRCETCRLQAGLDTVLH